MQRRVAESAKALRTEYRAMESLPWLVRNGHVVWMVALPAAIVWVVCLMRAFHRVAAARRRRLAHAQVAAAEAHDEATTEGEVTLRGTLVRAGEDVLRFEDGTPCAVATATAATQGSDSMAHRFSHRAATLRLKLGKDTVLLDGPIDVLFGSREQHTRKRVGRLGTRVTERLMAESVRTVAAEHVRRTAFGSVRDGEVVLVRGNLRRDISDDGNRAAHYRKTAGAWLLAPASEDGAIELAHDGRAAVPVRPLSTALAVLVGVTLFAAVFFAGGELATAATPGLSPDYDDPKRADFYPQIPVSAQLATATPFHREAMLEKLAKSYGNVHGRFDKQRLTRMQALAELADYRCGANDYVLEALGQHAIAAEIHERCGSPTRAAHHHHALGHYKTASRLYAQGKPDHGNARREAATTHLLAGEFERAADATHGYAETLTQLAAAANETPRDRPVLECLRSALMVRAGHADAISDLRRALRASDKYGDEDACSLLLASSSQAGSAPHF